MTINFECTSCKSMLKAKPKLAGMSLSCPKCSAPITVPVQESSPPAEPVKKAPPATEKQMDYARSLGIDFPEDIDRRSISQLIEMALDAQNQRERQLAEEDEEDPRISVATTEQILDGLAERDIGAILITFEYGVLSGVDDLTGEKFEINSTDDIDGDDLKTILSSLGVAMMRRKST